MYEVCKVCEKRARINSIFSCIIVTPLSLVEFNCSLSDFYKNMFKNCLSGRLGMAYEVVNVAVLLMPEKGSFITESDFLIDGG